MPKLILFCACEKLIVDRETNNVSLIALLEDFTVPIVGDDTMGKATLAPLVWYAFASWDKSDDDRDAAFEQRISIRLPDLTVTMNASLTFTFADNNRMRTYNPVLGFPIHVAGPCALILELRRVGEEHFEHIADYPIRVMHARAVGNEASPIAVPVDESKT